MQLTPHPRQAATRPTAGAVMALAEYGLELEPGSFRPAKIGPSAWALLVRSPEGLALGYIKEGN